MNNPRENMSRRKAVVVIGSGIGSLVLAACGYQLKIEPISTPSSGGSPGIRPAQAEPTPTTAPERAKYELSAGIELPAGWPLTREEALTAMGLTGATADNILPKFDADKKWTGQWVVEGFKLKTGVTFDAAQGVYVDAKNNPVYNDTDIYNFLTGTKYNSPQWFGVSLNIDQAYLFARTGGLDPKGKTISQVSIFSGVKGANLGNTFEQAALIPTKDCDPTIAAWVDALHNVVDNKYVADNVTVYTMDGDKKHLVDGSMLRAFKANKIDLTKIYDLPPGYPISPKEVGTITKTDSQKWMMVDTSGHWQFEAFPFIPGVYFDKATGLHMDKHGPLFVAKQIYDFNKYGPEQNKLWPTVITQPNNKWAFMVARYSGAGYPRKDVSYIIPADGGTIGDVTHTPGFEQAELYPISLSGCVLSPEDARSDAMNTAADNIRNSSKGITVEVVTR